MPRPEKEAAVAELEERISRSDGIFVTEYRGLTVAELAELRSTLRDRSAEFKVVRNTLTKLALERAGKQDLADFFEGPTAVAFYTGDPVTVAKALRDFSRSHPALVLKGASLQDSVLGADQVERLATIEPREVLLSKAAGAMKAPLYRVASTAAGILQKTAYLLGARLRDLEESGGATGGETSDSSSPALTDSGGADESEGSTASQGDGESEGEGS